MRRVVWKAIDLFLVLILFSSKTEEGKMRKEMIKRKKNKKTTGGVRVTALTSDPQPSHHCHWQVVD